MCTTTTGLFEAGFEAGLAMWRDGFTWELITNSPECDATSHGRGIWACAQTLSGCVATAEREARMHGFTMERAEALVQRAVDA
jgi:hypothetical protein